MATAIYARVSTQSEEQAHALEQQLHRLRMKAAEFGEPLVEFVDVASATRDDRPELKKLLKACEGGQLTTVICTRLDRMSRSTVHGGRLLRLFNQESWPNLICLDQPIDLSTAAGRFYASLLMSLAQMESELIGERVHHGQVYARTQMKPQAGKPPWGYRYTEGKMNYEVDEKLAPFAQEIVNELLKTASLQKAFAYQEAHCGAPFKSTEGLKRWLLNPAITGARVYGTCKWVIKPDSSKRRLINPPGEVGEIHRNTHPALISEEQQKKVAAVVHSLGHRRLTPIRPRRTRVLTNLLECGYCGHTMSHHYPRKDGPHYYRCTYRLCAKRPHTAIREDEAVQAAIDVLADHRQLLAYGGVIKELQLRQQLSPEVQKLQAQIRDLKLLDDPEVAGVIARKAKRLDALINERIADGGSRFSLDDAEAALDRQEVWDELLATPERQRELFSQWLQRMVVRDGAVVETRLRTGGGAPSSS